MDISSWEVYWIMQLTSIKVGIGITIAIVASVCAIFAIFAGLCGFDDKENKPARRLFYVLLFVFIANILFIPIYSAIPSTKTMAAVYIVPRLADSTFVREEVPRLYDLAIERLEEELTNIDDIERE